MDIVIDRGVSTIIAAVVGALIASIVSALVANRSFKHQAKLLYEQLKQQRDLFYEEQKERFKLIELQYKQQFNVRKMDKLEDTYLRLLNIELLCSPTSSFILSISKDIENVHHTYLNVIAKDVNRIKKNTYLFFPNSINEINEISSQANLYWGHQQDYMRHISDNYANQDIANNSLAEVHKAINKLSYLAKQMRNKLESEFGSINS